eukprot:4545245-Pleurochrysis_carterae.AAC.3
MTRSSLSLDETLYRASHVVRSPACSLLVAIISVSTIDVDGRRSRLPIALSWLRQAHGRRQPRLSQVEI